MPDIPDFLRRNPDNTGGAKDWSPKPDKGKSS
jgi:hypothetical protein